MGNLKKNLLLIGMMLTSSLCFAKQISFQIIQHDDANSDVTEESLVIEDVMMNSFFEKGYIVTNSETVSASEGDDDNLYKAGLSDAFNGYSDLFVQINLFYVYNPASLKNVSSLEKIKWTVTETKTERVIDSKSINDIKPFANNKDRDNFTNVLVNEINKSILVKKN